MTNFLEPIYYDNSPLSNTVESLFYWEGISDRLGYRQFTYVNGKLESLPSSKYPWLWTALKVALCSFYQFSIICLIGKYVIRQSRKWTHEKELDQLKKVLDTFQIQLKTDLQEGKIICTSDVIKDHYKNILEYLEKGDPLFTRSYQTIVNREMVILELKNQPHKELRSETEQVIMSALGYTTEESDLKKIHKEAEARILNNILNCITSDPLSKETIRKELLKSRIEAAAPREAEALSIFILNMERRVESLKQQLQAIPLPKEMSALSKLDAAPDVADFRDKLIKKTVQQFVSKIKPALVQGDLSHLFEANSAACLATYQKSMITSYQPTIDFYARWQNRLKTEFIQGAGDLHEILGEGACTSVSIRWAKKEQLNPHLPDAEIMENERIFPKDRFLQALYKSANAQGTLNRQPRHILYNQHPIEILGLKERFGLKKITLLSLIEKKEDFDSCFQTNKKQLAKNHGVALMTLFGHQIYIRCDEAKNIYRIGDPNVGLLSLKNSEEFIECLKDLVATFYTSDPMLIRLFQLDLLEAEKPEQPLEQPV